jgi:predicted nucleic acid-binding protein
MPPESAGDLCVCAITRLEILHSARSSENYQEIEQELDSFHELRIDAETIRTAVAAHRELGERERHRIPVPDLLIASCAQQHQAAVIHVDRHYDALTEVLAFQALRLDNQ